MAPSDPAPVVGGVAFALCPLLCLGVPVLLTAVPPDGSRSSGKARPAKPVSQ